VTAETGSGINPPINPVPGKIITAMLGATIGIGLSSQGRFEFGIHRVAIVAETLLMAHGAELRPLTGQRSMIIRKIYRVVESVEDHATIGLIMAIGTDRPPFPQIGVSRMYRRAAIADCGSQQPGQNHNRQDGYKLFGYFRHRYSSPERNL
jgi:hypothetical protein